MGQKKAKKEGKEEQRKTELYPREEVLKRSQLSDWEFKQGRRYGIIAEPIGKKRAALYTEEHIERARWLQKQLGYGRVYKDIAEDAKHGRFTPLGPAHAECLRQTFRLRDDIVVSIPVSGAWRDFSTREALANALFETCQAVAGQTRRRSKRKKD